jgi:SnoaL-like domain
MTDWQDAGAATLADRQAISDAITGLLDAIDRRDWTAARSHLAAQVTTNYTSLFGGSPRTQSDAELIEGWCALLTGFDATQHLTGPILADISENTARVRCAVTAIHCIGQDHWTPSGHYELELLRAGSRWVISAIVYRNAFVAGDGTLPQKAQARARRSEEHTGDGPNRRDGERQRSTAALRKTAQ